MSKDYVKIFNAVDLKRAKQEAENIIAMQAADLYPKEFSFPITLQFELTGACNLKCKHCYNRSGDVDRVQYTSMTPQKWKSLAKQIVEAGGIFQCIISGGEPLLLGEDLFDIMDILHEDGTSFVVITNGMLLSKEKVKRFSKYRYFWFQISIDGSTPELHDSFRGVEGSWEKAVNGAMEISDSGIPLVIAHSVTPKTLPYLDDMVKLAYSVGAGSIMIGEILPSGRAIFNKDIFLTHEQRNYLYEQIDKLSREYAGKIRIERSMNVNTSMERYVSAPNSGGIIRPNGDFRLDCMTPFTIGNVLDETIDSIWKNKGKYAWHNPKVLEFINSIDAEKQKGNILNHVNDDIRI
ncbi:radical SAM protein [Phascolarctobacterium sp. Marseille-Q4147]|uniref:Fe-S oxidoreductase n=1 Tax=Phascolarctobacterium succinatutens CAG:287 TaxID=1263101 RepID=R6WLX9_9FIRM|nr:MULTISPECIES: radical SAM protein [Phascolarctobacterium]QTV78063.1 radical SAM protein [Phascolarctobacterium sp. Marseille-Q4147]CDD12158.1 fe-S oxidoreductase [Phascolarctobacterium succinatutens CAG:287]